MIGAHRPRAAVLSPARWGMQEPMANRLIIVESPSKARTLEKFLGPGFTVAASMGHVRDLPKSRLGVDVDHGFAPEYEVTKDKQVTALRKEARKADDVLLASDPDREGEAIAWHLAEALNLRQPERIVFHEITRPAVEAALRSPRPIDRDLVAAQEARRVIDRLVGYKLSPLLWKKVRKGLSAGRVQSVAVRLVIDRENEIDAFVPEEWWTVEARLRTESGEELTARLHARLGDADEAEEPEEEPAARGEGKDAVPTGRVRLGDEAAALEVLRALGVDDQGLPGPQSPPFRVARIVARQQSRNAPPPYTTSTLQQEASTRLRMTPRRTMSTAQQLYEGVDLPGEGPVGLITYMRTDSTRISDLARDAAHAHIRDSFGEQYVRRGAAPVRRAKAAPVEAQDAHEAIRPTDPARTPESVAKHLDRDQARLYELVWRRFVASQMAAARFDLTRVDLHAADLVFRASGSVLRFDGFLRVLRPDDRDDDRSLPALAEGQDLALQELRREQHFTQPPPRYTEASLIKELEERGIGRPSTYAPTVETIQERTYVEQLERRLHPTLLGRTVDTVLRENFPDIVDVDFTAELEKRLDTVQEGARGYEPTVREWYGPFSQTLTRAEESMERVHVETGETCPECGEGQLVLRQSKFGEFAGCSRYPDCKYIKREAAAAPQPTGDPCPDCGRELVVRQGKRGPFVGCSGYPECRYIRGDSAPSAGQQAGDGAAGEDLGVCPDCGRPLGRKTGRRGPFVGCTGYPECKYIQPAGGGAARPQPQPTGEACPQCGKELVLRHSSRGPFVGCSGYPKCRYVKREAAAAQGGGRSPAPAGEPVPELGPCPDCGRELVRRQGRYGPFISCSGYPGCKYRPPRGTETAAPAAAGRTR